MTEAEYQRWLADLSAARVVLCELDYATAQVAVTDWSTGQLSGVVVDDGLILAPSRNLCPPFSEWALSGDAVVDAGDVLHLNAYGARAVSPMIPIDGAPAWAFSAEYFDETPAPVNKHNPDGTLGGRLLGSAYFAADGTPVDNARGYPANSNARAFALNAWSDRAGSAAWPDGVGGPAVAYLQITLSTSSSWTSADFEARLPMLTAGSATFSAPYQVYGGYTASGSRTDYVALPGTDYTHITIGWRSDEPPGTGVSVELSRDGGSSWQTVAQGVAIPWTPAEGAPLLRQTLTTTDTHVTPRLTALSVALGGTEYVASQPYISHPADAAPNRIYDDLLVEAVDIETRIDGLISFGEVALVDDGEIIGWIDRAWRGHAIRLYLGGPDWPRDDFRLHAVGINGGVTNARRGELAFEMVDQSAKLDEPIDTGKLPDNAGAVPLALGSVYNAPAYRSASATLEYTASFLPVTTLAPKDSGNPVPHTDDLAGGKFTLDAVAQGELSVDIAESHNTPTLIAQWVAGHYGLTLGDIDLPGYTVGLHYADEVSGRQILDDLCAGLGAYWYLDPLGRLTVRQHVIPTDAEVTLFADDIEYDRLELSETQPPWASLTLRWGRNYKTLTTVAGVVDADTPTEAARLKREWSESSATQAMADYPLAEDVTRDSCISNAADATTERDRLLLIRAERRDVYALDAFMPVVEVGMAIAVEHPRLSGRIGRIISVSRSPTRGITSLEVWV